MARTTELTFESQNKRVTPGSNAGETENAAFFLRLDLPSILIRHENGALQTRGI